MLLSAHFLCVFNCRSIGFFVLIASLFQLTVHLRNNDRQTKNEAKQKRTCKLKFNRFFVFVRPLIYCTFAQSKQQQNATKASRLLCISSAFQINLFRRFVFSCFFSLDVGIFSADNRSIFSVLIIKFKIDLVWLCGCCFRSKFCPLLDSLCLRTSFHLSLLSIFLRLFFSAFDFYSTYEIFYSKHIYYYHKICLLNLQVCSNSFLFFSYFLSVFSRTLSRLSAQNSISCHNNRPF